MDCNVPEGKSVARDVKGGLHLWQHIVSEDHHALGMSVSNAEADRWAGSALMSRCNAVALAAEVKRIQDAIKEVRSESPQPAKGFGEAPLPATSNVSPGPIESVLGKGQAKDGMFKVVIGRSTKMPCDCEVGKEMGVNTWAAFYGTDDDALVDGDFAVFEGELQGVLKSLRGSGINIVAIHSHMESENPKVLFLHYWGRGKTADLAKALKAALNATKT